MPSHFFALTRIEDVGTVNGLPVLLPAGAICPSRSFAGLWIQYQSMRRMPGIEVEHIDQRTGQRVERTITYPAQIPVVFDEPQYGSLIGKTVIDKILFRVR